MPRPRLLRSAILVLALAAAAGCAGATQSGARPSSPAPTTTIPQSAASNFVIMTPDEVAREGLVAMEQVRSFRLRTHFAVGQDTMDLDLHVNGPGECSGRVTERGLTASLILSGDSAYVRGEGAFWRRNATPGEAQVMARLGHRWAKLPATRFKRYCALKQLLKATKLDHASLNELTYNVGPTSTIDGRQVIELTQFPTRAG